MNRVVVVAAFFHFKQFRSILSTELTQKVMRVCIACGFELQEGTVSNYCSIFYSDTNIYGRREARIKNWMIEGKMKGKT